MLQPVLVNRQLQYALNQCLGNKYDIQYQKLNTLPHSLFVLTLKGLEYLIK